MMGRTAVNTSQVAWLAALPVAGVDIRTGACGFVIAGIAAYGPDLDHGRSTFGQTLPKPLQAFFRKASGGHRMATHSIVAVLFVFGLTLILGGAPWAAWAVAVGWGSHIFTDLLTVRGVGLLWPFLKRPIRIGNLITGGRGEKIYDALVKANGIALLAFYTYKILESASWPTFFA